MFKNSLNANNGFIKEINPDDIIYGIKYYDTMYRKVMYINYDSKEKRDLDFNNITDYNYSYFKVEGKAIKSFDYGSYREEERQYLDNNAYLFKYCNPHPQKKVVGDCVKRAICLATEVPYREVQIQLNRHKRQLNSGRRSKIKAYNYTANFVPFIENNLGGIKLPNYRNMKIGEFAKLNLEGRYIIKCRKHLTCVIDGIIFDTWNCGFKAITRIWKVSI